MPIHKQQISRGVYGCVSFEAARMVEKRTVQWKERLGSIAPRLAEFKRKGPLRRSPLAGASPFRVSKRFKKQRADRRKKPPGGGSAGRFVIALRRGEIRKLPWLS
jgi:hypothetical protein